jgi:phosphinothricin acetyltransferase
MLVVTPVVAAQRSFAQQQRPPLASHACRASAASAAPSFAVREVETVADVHQMADLYAEFVTSSVSTLAYEGEAPSRDEFCAKWRSRGALPWLVALDSDGTLMGYLFVGPFRARAGWRFAAEHSIYVRPSCQRRGVGAALLRLAVERYRAAGVCTLMAVISSCTQTGVGQASVQLHASCGWEHWATLPRVGVKSGQVLDVTFMRLTVNELTPEMEHF